MTKKTNIYLTTKDFLVTGEEFELLIDEKRSMLITHPIPNPEDLYKYYNSDNYISHATASKGIVDRIYRLVRKYTLSKKVKLMNKLSAHKGRHLDVGAGTGEFLSITIKSKWDAIGIEPNDKARTIAKSKKLNVYKSFEDLPSNKFDVITLWHVLEHIHNLDKTVEKLESLLNPNGVLIIAVPNFKSYDAKFYKQYWAALDTPRHLWHFSRNSIRHLFSTSMKIDSIRPMLFDSFYVSLLSEKYKTNSNSLIRAFFIGFWSNIKAWKTKEYSSLIYCLRKID